MKLKFRAEKKDVVAFAWGCLLLLLIVSICVYNLKDTAIESEVVQRTGISLNPIPGLLPPYLGYTILYWLITIIILVASVSSHFFEREKGFGFKEGKDEKGFGRFAKEYEYKQDNGVEEVDISAKESTAGGFPLLFDKKKNKVYVDNGEFHSLVIGATGSGKTQTVIFPQVDILAKAGESMVITDPKGEIFNSCAGMLKDLGYEVIVVNFRDPQNGSCWNPYTLPYKYYKEGNQDKANELLNDMAINIATDEKADDPFWTNSAADFLTGLSLGMFEDAAEDEISISTVNLMMTVGDEKMGSSTYLKEYFKMKDPASPAAINALGTINAPQETKNSIDSVLKQKIKVFAVTQNLSEMLSRSDFDMETIGERKTAIFMVIQDEKTTYHALATIFIKQCYECLISVAQRHGGKLPIRTNFLIDEFANMPKFKDITTMVTAARSRGIRFTFIIQNFAQLNDTYGKEDAETIRGNCGNIVYLLTGELSALEEISKLCGDKIVKVGKDKREETRPLITVTELQKFKQFEVLVLRFRLPPLRTHFMPFFETDYGYGKYNCNAPKEDLPHHEKQPIKLFDIREFVKKKKEEQRNSMMGGDNPFGGNNPFGGGGNPFSNNPFGGGSPFGAPPIPTGMEASNPFGAPSAPNPFAGDALPTNNETSSEELNIDDLIKKIDSKIAELEEEEKNEQDAKDNEEIASEKEMVEDTKTIEDIKLPDDIKSIDEKPINDKDEVLSSDAIISSDKVDFSGLQQIKPEVPEVHDIMDDYLEDLSSPEDEVANNTTVDSGVKEAVIEQVQEQPNIDFNNVPLENEVPKPVAPVIAPVQPAPVVEPTPASTAESIPTVAPVEQPALVVEQTEVKPETTSSNDVYVNKEEVDKIMSEPDEEDFFDDFFE